MSIYIDFHKRGKMKARKLIAIATIAVTGFLTLPANAAEPASNATLNAIEKVAPQVFNNLEQAQKRGESRGDFTRSVGTARLFDSAANEISLDIDGITSETKVMKLGNELTIFNSVADTDFVPLTKVDGSVQTLAVLNSTSAPEVLRFELSLPAGASIQQLETGELMIQSNTGEFLGGIAPAWAKDAQGVAVDTWFEVKGSTLFQIVKHKAGNFSYPIVADPWLGIDLYYQPTISFLPKGYRINVTPTVWGGTFTGASTWFAHRDEVVTKLGTSAYRWTATIQEQFYCHIAGWPASLPQYNMESWSRLVNWSISLALYQCNPDKGTWY